MSLGPGTEIDNRLVYKKQISTWSLLYLGKAMVHRDVIFNPDKLVLEKNIEQGNFYLHGGTSDRTRGSRSSQIRTRKSVSKDLNVVGQWISLQTYNVPCSNSLHVLENT